MYEKSTIHIIMKALIFENTGKPLDVLGLEELSLPVRRDGDLLVRMLASPVNPADLLFMSGSYRLKPIFPQIGGLEGAGIVEESGDSGIPSGTLVSVLQKNCWAEYVAVSPENVLALPSDFAVSKAALFTLNPFTAWGLLEKADMREGDWLLLTAASSFVAKLVIQFAVRKKIRVIAAVRDVIHQSTLERLAAVVINQNMPLEELKERVHVITGGTGAQCIMDPVGGETATRFLQCLGLNGRFIAYGRLDTAPAEYYHSDIVYKNISIVGFGVRGYLEQIGSRKNEIASQLITIMNSPNFLFEVNSLHTLSAFKDAFNLLESRQIEGKVLLTMNV